MTLARFKARNHPQQVQKRGADDAVDERITPDWLFERFNAQHAFTLDAAASAANAKAPAHYSREVDGLKHDWAPHRVWCNPPYSNLDGWLEKAHAEFAGGCPSIVLLLPANRTEQGWWQVWVEPFRDRPDGFMRSEFIFRRVNFGLPGNPEGKFKSAPPFGLVALTFAKQQAAS